MYAQKITVAAPVDGSGNATVFSPVLTGRIINVIYVADGSTPYDNTVDFTITGEDSGLSILSQTNVAAGFTLQPRQPTHSQAGAAALYAAGGTAVNDHIYLGGERIKIAIVQGGVSKTGQFVFIVS